MNNSALEDIKMYLEPQRKNYDIIGTKIKINHALPDEKKSKEQKE